MYFYQDSIAMTRITTIRMAFFLSCIGHVSSQGCYNPCRMFEYCDYVVQVCRPCEEICNPAYNAALLCKTFCYVNWLHYFDANNHLDISGATTIDAIQKKVIIIKIDNVLPTGMCAFFIGYSIVGTLSLIGLLCAMHIRLKKRRQERVCCCRFNGETSIAHPTIMEMESMATNI